MRSGTEVHRELWMWRDGCAMMRWGDLTQKKHRKTQGVHGGWRNRFGNACHGRETGTKPNNHGGTQVGNDSYFGTCVDIDMRRWAYLDTSVCGGTEINH